MNQGFLEEDGKNTNLIITNQVASHPATPEDTETLPKEQPSIQKTHIINSLEKHKGNSYNNTMLDECPKPMNTIVTHNDLVLRADDFSPLSKHQVSYMRYVKY